MPRKSKAAAAAAGDDSASAPTPRRSTRIRKYVVYPDEVEGEPVQKKARGKRASTTNVSYEEEENSNEPSKDSAAKDDEFDPNEDEAEDQPQPEEKPKTPARGRGRGRRGGSSAHKDTPAPKSAGRGRGRKRIAVQEQEDEEEDEEEAAEENNKKVESKPALKKKKFEDVPEAKDDDEEEDEDEVDEEKKVSTTEVKKDSGKGSASAEKDEGGEKKKATEDKKTEKKDNEAKSEGEKKKDQSTADASADKKAEEAAQDNKKASEDKKETAKSTSEAPAATEATSKPKEDTKTESAPPAATDAATAPAKETNSAKTDESTKETKTKENGVSAGGAMESKTGYEANSKKDAPTEKDVSVASLVAPTGGDVAKDTKEALDKADGAEVVAVQKSSPAAAEAAESCGFKVIGSGATCLFVKAGHVELVDEIETGSLGALAHRELDSLSSQSYRAKVETYLNEHNCPTDEFTVATLRVRGKSFTLVNVQMETKNLSVAALLIGCLMRHLDSRPHAFMLTGHMPYVWPDRPAYELLRDGYFGNSSIETLQKMKDIRIDVEDKVQKGLIDFVWKAYQHSRPWMRSVYETVLNGENALSSSGRSMLWHSTKGVGVVRVLNHNELVKADLAISRVCDS